MVWLIVASHLDFLMLYIDNGKLNELINDIQYP